MTSKFSNKFLIPEKFPEILHDYSREVIRYMPKDILDFSIQYFYYLEKGLPLNYIDGGSNNIPKLTINDDVKVSKETINSQGLTTNQNTQNMFYKQNEMNEIKELNMKNINEVKGRYAPIISEESRNSKRSDVSHGSGIIALSKNFVNDIYEEHERMMRESNKKKQGNRIMSGKSDRLDTFSNISGNTNDKNGVRNFVGNVMEVAMKFGLDDDGIDNNDKIGVENFVGSVIDEALKIALESEGKKDK